MVACDSTDARAELLSRDIAAEARLIDVVCVAADERFIAEVFGEEMGTDDCERREEDADPIPSSPTDALHAPRARAETMPAAKRVRSNFIENEGNVRSEDGSWEGLLLLSWESSRNTGGSVCQTMCVSLPQKYKKVP